jgi:hypothetical protein
MSGFNNSRVHRTYTHFMDFLSPNNIEWILSGDRLVSDVIPNISG